MYYSSFIDNICGADLTDMQLISKFNKGFRFLLCVIDIYSKNTWVVLLRHKKSITISNAFQKIFKKSNRKRNKVWVDKGSEFCNRSIKSWLEKMVQKCIQHINKVKYVVAERFLRDFKNKIYKYMTSVSKNVYREKLDDIVNKYNNVLTLVKKLIIKTQTLELVTLLEYQNVKTFLQKIMFQIGLKRFL